MGLADDGRPTTVKRVKMLDIIIQENLGKSDREVLHNILVNQHFINLKLDKIMSAAEDLQALVNTLTGNLATATTSLDSIKTGVATIVAGLPVTGGMTADEVAALKVSLQVAVDKSTAVAAEASEDAAAVAAAQPPVTAPTV